MIMKSTGHTIKRFIIPFIGIGTLILLFVRCGHDPARTDRWMLRAPVIQPDYSDITLPPNIAPLNFRILEDGDAFRVAISSARGESIRIVTRSPRIQIPSRTWKRMLADNPGQSLAVEVFVQQKGEWTGFQKIVNHIAAEKVDPFLVYRILNPAFNLWKKMGIYQRDVESFEEKPVLRNTELANCLNCHAFCNQDPSRWSLHMRYSHSGMLISQGDKVTHVDTRTAVNQSPGAYTAWHPSGQAVAFSTDKVKQFFHATGENRDVLDLSSDLFLFFPSSNTVKTFPQIASPDRMETLPTWSPDGRFLYFCSAPQIDPNESFKDQYKDILYSVMRISYDPSIHVIGEPETVLSLASEHKTVSHPKISPDGNFLMCSVADYGYFTIYHPESDLCLLNLETGERSMLALNSDQAESYHSWSSNSRWVVFSSKRDDGIFTRLYFSYIDETGSAHKPFVLPQKDPSFYDQFLWVYNVPELITARIPQSERKLLRAAQSSAVPSTTEK
jgi:hypothetical protein